MLTVGLTGGIATGKSLVRAGFAELGCATLDSDRIARRLVAPGQSALAEITQAFGPDLLQSDGQLDRARLGARVFRDPASRRRLEAILHPRIFALQEQFLTDARAAGRFAVAMIDAALMFETGSYRRYSVVIVVHCRLEQQLERLRARDLLSAAEAQRRIAAQWPLEEKARRADLVIDNSGSRDATARQVNAAYLNLLSRLAFLE
ncbi:MAG TPA: dephospho-CoA kinase [Acidobacteriota bacterium]